ncbi:hypothetical protein D915_007607 [Fasciola hepatica]|uniref:Secreted protein n=1 Tax=Fasciola hepatica TaxID=6192 RepID=A0A4E0R2A1_FASHE|nr:hypothetical protein D915_007607 [Fasciola hepatica]
MIFQRLLTIWVLLIELWILCEAKNKNKKPIGSVIQPARSSYGGSVNKPPYPVSSKLRSSKLSLICN